MTTINPHIFISTGNKTVLVECGVFSRLVNFADGGNDVVLLLEAITRNFRGLRKTHIALLKIKSEKYSGHFVDIVGTNMTIQDNSIIKVVPFSKVIQLKEYNARQ